MVILGAGGQAKDILSILTEVDKNDLFFYDDLSTTRTTLFLNAFPIIRTINELKTKLKKDKRLVIGTGNPLLRLQLAKKVKGLSFVLHSVISNSAIIGKEDVKLEEGLNIMDNVFISNSVEVGQGTLINRLAGLHHDVKVGQFCDIGPGATLLGGCQIGNQVLIGAGAIILPKITIGSGAVIGAGAVVTKSVQKSTTVMGVPATMRIKSE